MPRYFQNMPVVGKPVRANAENVAELRAIEDDIHAHIVDALSCDNGEFLIYVTDAGNDENSSFRRGDAELTVKVYNDAVARVGLFDNAGADYRQSCDINNSS